MICKQCSTEKSHDGFYRLQSAARGHATICKECHKARMRALRRTNPEVQRRDRDRAKTPPVKARLRENTIRWRKENPMAYKAHTAVSNAVRDGKLTKLPCEFCGDTRVHAHHKDYSKPLDVIWLCPKCHHRLHAAFPELEGRQKAS